MAAYYLVQQRPRDWRDWAKEADYAVAHGVPMPPATPQPTDLFPGDEPSFGPLVPVKVFSDAGAQDDPVAKPSNQFDHLFWDTTKPKAHEPDPLIFNYPLDLPRDVNDAFSHMLTNPTVLSAHIVEQPINPFARPQVPLAQATNWPAADVRFAPAQPYGNTFAQSPYTPSYYAQPSLGHTPAAQKPALLPAAVAAPAPEPVPTPRTYVPYVNNINGPREPKKEAVAAIEGPPPLSPAKGSKKTPKADPRALAAATKENKSAAPTPAQKPIWMPVSNASSPKPATAPTPKGGLFFDDTAFPMQTPQQALGVHPAQRVDPNPQMRANLRGAVPVTSQLKKTPKARVETVEDVDAGWPYGGQGRHQRSRSEANSPTVRFADQGAFARPPSPTQQLDTLVSRVQARQQPATFATLYESEHRGRSAPNTPKKRGGLFSSGDSDAGASSVLGFGFASPSHVHAQPVKKGKGSKHGAAR